jgi:hypothetical protein
MRKRRRSQRGGVKRRQSRSDARPKTLDELWTLAGARNVAGVTYQVAVDSQPSGIPPVRNRTNCARHAGGVRRHRLHQGGMAQGYSRASSIIAA